MAKKIIGFAGRKRSGKTTICEYLRDTKSAEIITIASGLKKLCANILCVSIDELNKLKDSEHILGFSIIDFVLANVFKNYNTDVESYIKQIFSEKCGIDITDDDYNGLSNVDNVRSLLQYVGTDIIRKYNPDWHCQQLKKSIEESESDIVVIDDIRFPNERKVIEELGGTVFFVIRPDMLEVSNHESETSLHWQDFDDNRIIVNNSTIERMCSNISEYIDCQYTFGNDNGSLKSGLYTYEIQPYNLNFGRKSNYNKIESDFIENYILSNDVFRTTGVINIWIENIKDFDICRKYLFRFTSKPDILSHGFQVTLYNPFIIENLKEWL